MPNQFILNQWTTLTVSQMYNSVTTNSTWMKFSFYPSMEASTIASLTGRKSHSFANPKIAGLKMLK